MRVAKLLLMLLTVSTIGCNNSPPDVPVDEECIKLSNGSLCLTPEPSETCIAAAGTDTCDFTVTPMNVPPQNIVVGGPKQFLGGYTVNTPKEGVSVGALNFYIHTSALSPLLRNIVLYDNETGAIIVAGPVDAVRGEGNSQIVIFIDGATYPQGKSSYVLKSRIDAKTPNDTTFTVSFNPSKDWTDVKKVSTGQSVTFPNTLLTMSTVTARGPALSVSQTGNPPAHTIIAGMKGVVFAEFQFDATESSEDMHVPPLNLTLNPGPGAYADLSACQLFNGATPLNTGSNTVNPDTWAETFIYDSTLTVPKGTIMTASLKCNVSSSTPEGSMFTWRISTEQIKAVMATGTVSGISVSATGTGISGSTMTIGKGSLSVSTSPRSPQYTIVTAGSEPTAGVFDLLSLNEAHRLKQVGVALVSGSPSDIQSGTVWVGEQQVGTLMFVGSNTEAVAVLTEGVTLPADADTAITVKLQLAEIGIGQTGTPGAYIRIALNPKTTLAFGLSSGLMTQAVGYTETKGFRMFESVPRMALDRMRGDGLATNGELLHFTVEADPRGSINIGRLGVSIICAGANVNDISVYAYTDPYYSVPVSGFAEGQLVNLPHWTIPQNNLWISISQENGILIPAGIKYYIRVRGAISSSNESYACETKVVGDAHYSPHTGADTFVMGTKQQVQENWSNLIYNTNGSSNPEDTGWTNGGGVPECFMGECPSQTRTK